MHHETNALYEDFLTSIIRSAYETLNRKELKELQVHI